jgi:branched-chain amino acid transport system ATP-binding protein
MGSITPFRKDKKMSEPLLAAKGLQAGYGDVQILWGVDIAVPKGKIVSIVGSNGAGKTTLLLTLSALVKLRSGNIMFDGKEVTNLPPDQIVQTGIAHVPEGRRLFRGLSVHDNLLLGAYNRRDGKEEIERDLDFVYSLFPILRERAKQDATTMSGGQQQMCAIGRGIMARPKLLIIDELSLGLAPRAVELLAESLIKVNDNGISILLVEQDVATAFEISHYGYVLESGRVMMHGPTSELINDPTVRQAYMGI